MTRSRHTRASLTDVPSLRQDRLDGRGLDEASRRAWTRAMTVRPFGDAYLVDCDDDTHYVSLAPSSCSCDAGETVDEAGDDSDAGDAGDADAATSNAAVAVDADHCEHVRRVAIEINLGRVPPPTDRTVPCRGCDRPVAVSAADAPPALCADCHLEPGDLVVDAEGDAETPLLVVSEPGRPAEFVTVPDDGRTVAAYDDNDAYPSDAPVVAAVYPQAVSIDREPRRYLFPIARLRQPGADRPPERGEDDRENRNGADCELHAGVTDGS